MRYYAVKTKPVKGRVRKRSRFRLRIYHKVILLTILASMIFGWSLKTMNTFLEPRLQALAKQQVAFAINNIAKEVLKDLEYDPNELMNIQFNDKGEVIQVDYDSYRLNQILFSALETIDDSLLAAQDGKADPATERVFYEDGIIYEVPVGYLTKISFLANVGPSIPVKMRLLNDVTGRIVTSSEPYGINNTMVKVSLEVTVQAQAITVLNVTPLESKTEIPIIMQLVNGRVPAFTPYSQSENP